MPKDSDLFFSYPFLVLPYPTNIFLHVFYLVCDMYQCFDLYFSSHQTSLLPLCVFRYHLHANEMVPHWTETSDSAIISSHSVLLKDNINFFSFLIQKKQQKMDEWLSSLGDVEKETHSDDNIECQREAKPAFWSSMCLFCINLSLDFLIRTDYWNLTGFLIPMLQNFINSIECPWQGQE